MNCSQEVFPYLTFQNQSRTVDTKVETCLVEPKAVCESRKRTDCAQITVRNCSQVSHQCCRPGYAYIHSSVVVEQAGEDPFDGDHNAEHDSDGDVRAAKLRIVLTYHA